MMVHKVSESSPLNSPLNLGSVDIHGSVKLHNGIGKLVVLNVGGNVPVGSHVHVQPLFLFFQPVRYRGANSNVSMTRMVADWNARMAGRVAVKRAGRG